jgi:hypothetical protein
MMNEFVTVYASCVSWVNALALLPPFKDIVEKRKYFLDKLDVDAIEITEENLSRLLELQKEMAAYLQDHIISMADMAYGDIENFDWNMPSYQQKSVSRKTTSKTTAITPVDKKDPKRVPIMKDDITNLKIDLGKSQDVNDFLKGLEE